MKIKNIAAICCMTVLAGCQQAEEIENPSEKLPMKIEASIGNQTESRYISNDGTPNNLSFDKGESIGVFVDNNPIIQWTKGTGETWTPETTEYYWPDKINEHNFYAFYPWKTGSSKGSIPMPSLLEQTGEISDLSSHDFLIAKTSETYGEDGMVSFTGDDSFKHVSALIAITVKGNGDLSQSTINKISFEGTNIASATTYSFENNSISIVEDKKHNKMEADLDYEMNSANKTFYFIVNAGNNLSGTKFSIEYSTGDKNYKATKEGLGSGTLTSGKQYSFNLTVVEGVLTISGNTIKDWESSVLDDIIINGVEQQTETPES